MRRGRHRLNGGGGRLSSKSCARLSLVLLLGSCFSVHIWNWMAKCLERDTIMVLSTNQDPSLRLPTLAFCPDGASGFDSAGMRALDLPALQWAGHEAGADRGKWRAPTSRSQVDRWHRESTYRFDDFISGVTFHNGQDHSTLRLHPAGGGGAADNGTAVELRELESLAYGRCYVVSVNFPIVTTADFVSVSVRFPRHAEVVNVLAFERGLEPTGVSVDLWPAPVYQARLGRRRRAHLGLTKRSQYLDHKNSYCLPNVSRPENVACLVREAKGLIDGGFGNCSSRCYWPGLLPWSDDYNDDDDDDDNHNDSSAVCTSLSELRCMHAAVAAASHRILGQRRCLPDCRVDVLSHHWRDTPSKTKTAAVEDDGDGDGDDDGGGDDNASSVTVVYVDTEVEFSSERVLYDFVTILSSVGGSMGLFLGFSFLDFCLLGVEYLWQWRKWN